MPAPMRSGSEVVGAAKIAPDGAKDKSFKASRLRMTSFRYGPRYEQRADHSRHHCNVLANAVRECRAEGDSPAEPSLSQNNEHGRSSPSRSKTLPYRPGVRVSASSMSE